jgi:hypothetical protein
MEITKIYWCPVTPPKRPGSAPGAGHVSLNVIVLHSSWTSRLGTTSITLGSVSYVVKRKIQRVVALGTVKCGRWYSTMQWHCSKVLFGTIHYYCINQFEPFDLDQTIIASEFSLHWRGFGSIALALAVKEARSYSLTGFNSWPPSWPISTTPH